MALLASAALRLVLEQIDLALPLLTDCPTQNRDQGARRRVYHVILLRRNLVAAAFGCASPDANTIPAASIAATQ